MKRPFLVKSESAQEHIIGKFAHQDYEFEGENLYKGDYIKDLAEIIDREFEIYMPVLLAPIHLKPFYWIKYVLGFVFDRIKDWLLETIEVMKKRHSCEHNASLGRWWGIIHSDRCVDCGKILEIGICFDIRIKFQKEE